MRFTFPLIIAAALLAVNPALADIPKVPTVVAKQAIDVSSKSISRTSEFSVWKTTIDTSDVIGSFRDGLFCTNAQDLYFRKQLNTWLQDATRVAFVEQSTKSGYPKHVRSDSAFEEKLGTDTDFKVGATLIGLQLQECGDSDQTKGSAYMKMKWELYSIQQQRVVYSKVVESAYETDKSMSYDDFLRNVVKADVANLLADPEFVATFESGSSGAQAKVDLPPIAAKSSAPVRSSVAKESGQLLPAVVSIESGVGMGSGFFVSDDGYILTNQHVVGGASFVKIKLSDGHSLVGQVKRIDNGRDVALVKVEAASPSVLRIRKQAPVVGEEVYAIGSPYTEALAGTLTRGVLSQRRTIDGLSYLQSDVSVKHGNSGGPLIDAKGDVIGITVMGLDTSGLNMFIPVDEALERLSLTIQ